MQTVGVYLAMMFCNFWPRQTFLPLFLGSVTEATGISVLAWALHQGHPTTIAFMMAFTGAGTGLRFMPGTLHGVGFSLNASPTQPGLPKLPPDILGPLEDKIREGVVWAFISILPFMWLCVLAATTLGNVKITRKRKIDLQGQMDFSENTTTAAFLPALLRSWFGGKKQVDESEVRATTERETQEQVQVTGSNGAEA